MLVASNTRPIDQLISFRALLLRNLSFLYYWASAVFFSLRALNAFGLATIASASMRLIVICRFGTAVRTFVAFDLFPAGLTCFIHVLIIRDLFLNKN